MAETKQGSNAGIGIIENRALTQVKFSEKSKGVSAPYNTILMWLL
jgi:hypothetical protein